MSLLLTDGWSWANGKWGMGIFLPPEVTEEESSILLEMQKRVEQRVKIYITDSSKHSRPIFGSNGNVINKSEVIAQCPAFGCNRRFRLTLKTREKYCPQCGQKLDWSTLDSYSTFGLE